MLSHIHIRLAQYDDLENIFQLYKKVSKTIGGLARVENEITQPYIHNIHKRAVQNGLQFVAVYLNTQIVGEIHCYKLEPIVFEHILSELTVAVSPLYQGKGIGKMLFSTLLSHIAQHKQEILRVELIARESNIKAIKFYEKIGFKIEGKMERRIKVNSTFEADMPMAWFNPNFKSIEL